METQVSSKTCTACKHWNDLGNNTGECRVRPPQAMIFKVDDQVQFETRFPVTKAEDWCGEFDVR